MKPEEIETLRNLMEYEAGRKAPPEGFPTLPDIPGGRYTDPRFFALEQAHIWRKILAAGRPHRRGARARLLPAVGNRRSARGHRSCRQRRYQRLLQHLQPSRRAGGYGPLRQAAAADLSNTTAGATATTAIWWPCATPRISAAWTTAAGA